MNDLLKSSSLSPREQALVRYLQSDGYPCTYARLLVRGGRLPLTELEPVDDQRAIEQKLDEAVQAYRQAKVHVLLYPRDLLDPQAFVEQHRQLQPDIMTAHFMADIQRLIDQGQITLPLDGGPKPEGFIVGETPRAASTTSTLEFLQNMRVSLPPVLTDGRAGVREAAEQLFRLQEHVCPQHGDDMVQMSILGPPYPGYDRRSVTQRPTHHPLDHGRRSPVSASVWVSRASIEEAMRGPHAADMRQRLDRLAQQPGNGVYNPNAVLIPPPQLQADLVASLARQARGFAAQALSSLLLGVLPQPKLGRNDACWCGSGRKFKVCHGRR